jgi:hypothetical protein
VLAFWLLPNLIVFIGQSGLEIIERYGWFFAIAGMAILLIFAWFFYLRYLLAKKALEAETHIQEYQLKLSRLPGSESAMLEIEKKSDPADILEAPSSKD